FASSVVNGVPPTPKLPLFTSSSITQVTLRTTSPSTLTMTSVSFSISSRFCESESVPSRYLILTNGINSPPLDFYYRRKIYPHNHPLQSLSLFFFWRRVSQPLDLLDAGSVAFEHENSHHWRRRICRQGVGAILLCATSGPGPAPSLSRYYRPPCRQAH